jgi:hypothetical protein
MVMVTALALLSRFGSGVAESIVAVRVMAPAFVTGQLDATVIENDAVWRTAIDDFEHRIVPGPPVGGVMQLHPAG